MNPTNSAQIAGSGTKSSTASGGSGATPFDEIVALEKKEAGRVSTELNAMEAERTALSTKLKKENEESQKSMRESAKEELKKFSADELSGLIKDAEKEGLAASEKLDQSYAGASKTVISSLTEKFIDGSFLSTAA